MLLQAQYKCGEVFFSDQMVVAVVPRLRFTGHLDGCTLRVPVHSRIALTFSAGPVDVKGSWKGLPSHLETGPEDQGMLIASGLQQTLQIPVVVAAPAFVTAELPPHLPVTATLTTEIVLHDDLGRRLAPVGCSAEHRLTSSAPGVVSAACTGETTAQAQLEAVSAGCAVISVEYGSAVPTRTLVCTAAAVAPVKPTLQVGCVTQFYYEAGISQRVFHRPRGGEAKDEIQAEGSLALLASDLWLRDIEFPVRVPSDGLWQSSDSGVLRISSDGRADALRPGEVTVTFQGRVVASTNVIVRHPDGLDVVAPGAPLVHGEKAFVPVVPRADRAKLEDDVFMRHGTRVSCDTDSLFFSAAPHIREEHGLAFDGSPHGLGCVLSPKPTPLARVVSTRASGELTLRVRDARGDAVTQQVLKFVPRIVVLQAEMDEPITEVELPHSWSSTVVRVWHGGFPVEVVGEGLATSAKPLSDTVLRVQVQGQGVQGLHVIRFRGQAKQETTLQVRIAHSPGWLWTAVTWLFRLLVSAAAIALAFRATTFLPRQRAMPTPFRAVAGGVPQLRPGGLASGGGFAYH
jgi:hypothetical protein